MEEDFLDELEKSSGTAIPEEQKETIRNRLASILTYQPKVGIFGKTGVGKSSLCNALFGQDVCKISDVDACTRDPQEVFIKTGGQGITLLDVPGVGETSERDKEYGRLYAKLLPELDLVLWVLKADDRAFTSDETFYKTIVKPHITEGRLPFLFVINQADKIEPFREWDDEKHEPGVNQYANIGRKKEAVSRAFQYPETRIIAISANEKYNLPGLVHTIVTELPKEKRIGFVREVSEENISEITQEEVRESWKDILSGIVTAVTGNPVLGALAPVAAKVVKKVVKGGVKVVKGIGKGIKKIGKWIF